MWRSWIEHVLWTWIFGFAPRSGCDFFPIQGIRDALLWYYCVVTSMQDISNALCDEENHSLSTNYFLFFGIKWTAEKGCTESRNLIIGECRRLRRISYYVRNFFPFMHLVEGVSVLADFKSWFLFVCAYVRDFWALGARTRWNVSTYSTAHGTKVTNRFPL